MKSDKQQRYLSIIMEHIIDVLYIKGDKNVVADCLSRSTCSVTIDSCNLPEISESQKEDQEINTYKSLLKPYEMQGSSIWCDVSTSTPILYIPKRLHRRIFDMFHISHSGQSPTVKIVKSRYFWPNMERGIRI